MGRLNHRQIEAFRAVHIAGTVSGAADMLFISQPAVSRLISDFEETIGINVFKREKGRLVPTSESLLLYEEVEKSFVSIDKIAQVAEELRSLHRGTLRIAAMPTMSLMLLPAIIREFTAAHDGVNVTLQVRSSQKVLEWISAQHFDLGFTAIKFTDAPVSSEHVADSRLVCVLPVEHPLANESVINPEMLEGQVFISLGPEQRVRYAVDEVFELAKVSRITSIDTQLSYTACAMVATGGGFSLVDPITALNFRDQRIAVKRFEPKIRFDYNAVFPTSRPRSNLAQSFFESVKKNVLKLADSTGGLFEIDT